MTSSQALKQCPHMRAHTLGRSTQSLPASHRLRSFPQKCVPCGSSRLCQGFVTELCNGWRVACAGVHADVQLLRIAGSPAHAHARTQKQAHTHACMHTSAHTHALTHACMHHTYAHARTHTYRRFPPTPRCELRAGICSHGRSSSHVTRCVPCAPQRVGKDRPGSEAYSRRVEPGAASQQQSMP